MTGMKTVIALRRKMVKPSAVFIDLVERISHLEAEFLSFNENTGIVHLTIAAEERLCDLDFRPLVGLTVHLHTDSATQARGRLLAAMVASVNPKHLVWSVPSGELTTVHQRFAGDPPRTESYTA